MQIDYTGDQPQFERPVGAVQAVLSDIVDLGMRPNKFAEDGKPVHKAVLTWQLAEKFKDKDGKELPFQQSEIITVSLNEKAKLRLFVEGMLGVSVPTLYAQAKAKGKEKFTLDIQKLIGRNCVLTLVKKENGYTQVQSVAPPMKNMAPITAIPLPRPEWIGEMLANKAQMPANGGAVASPADNSLDGIIDTL